MTNFVFARLDNLEGCFDPNCKIFCIWNLVDFNTFFCTLAETGMKSLGTILKIKPKEIESIFGKITYELSLSCLWKTVNKNVNCFPKFLVREFHMSEIVESCLSMISWRVKLKSYS